MTAETIPALLAQRAVDVATREAIVSDLDRIDYATLERRSAARAAWLVAMGVNKGLRVALLLPNGVEWAVNAYAIMRIGAVLTPLSTMLRPAELAAQLSVSGVHHLIAVSSHRGRNYGDEIANIDRTRLASLRHVWWAENLGDEAPPMDGAVAKALSSRVRPADDMAVIFSSGSRGFPKGVIYTHAAAIRATAASIADRCIRSDTRLYVPMPFFSVGGLGCGLLSTLIAGATLLTESIAEPATTLRFLERERATLFRDRANLFGMTETFGPYCGYPIDQDVPADKRGSCGRAFDGIELRVMEFESGEILAAGASGRIQVGGNNILRGICGREREDVFTKDGWYDTGDLGWLDKDGFLFFADQHEPSY
jgi:acyl-CoA synthetase (AMP-forming)/AMP-acid ligase II